VKRRLLLVLAIAALAGCGSEEEDGDSAAPAVDSRVEIVETEFALEPANVAVEAAGETTIRVVNNGSFPHALEVEGEGVEEETEEIAPGESAS
jgi:plastocyanin